MRRFGVSGKLAPRFIGPFPVVAKRGEVAYQLELPPQLSKVHDVFHVSQLRKCLRVPEEQMCNIPKILFAIYLIFWSLIGFIWILFQNLKQENVFKIFIKAKKSLFYFFSFLNPP